MISSRSDSMCPDRLSFQKDRMQEAMLRMKLRRMMKEMRSVRRKRCITRSRRRQRSELFSARVFVSLKMPLFSHHGTSRMMSYLVLADKIEDDTRSTSTTTRYDLSVNQQITEFHSHPSTESSSSPNSTIYMFSSYSVSTRPSVKELQDTHSWWHNGQRMRKLTQNLSYQSKSAG